MSKNTQVRNQVAPVAQPRFFLVAPAAHRLKEQSASLAGLATCNLEWELDIQAKAVRFPDGD